MVNIIMIYKTEQEEFWAGEFGEEYIQRNQSDQLLASNLDFFSKSLRATNNIKSCIEFGANIGMNLKALKLLYPKQELFGIEINKKAATELYTIIPKNNIYQKSILEFDEYIQCDLVLIKGVLIHINPNELQTVYEKLVKATKKYLLVAEYYNPTPVSISYRGHSDKLFKRDFAGEIIDKYPEFNLIDYGFIYHRDHNFPQDDITWFLMERSN
jgi:pseudaminic acid biosynthesis-associated methylase